MAEFPADLPAALVAAGHDGAQQGSGLFIKPTLQQEIDFYVAMNSVSSPLVEYIPQHIGTLQVQPDSGKPSDPTIDHQPVIVLEDLCAYFTQPSILDVKLGSVLWDEHATPEKRARLQSVASSTTSSTLGFRIAGMTVVQPTGERRAYGKEFGRNATAETIVEHLAAFFPALHTDDLILSVLSGFVRELEALRRVLAVEPVEMHSASVLLVYEGDCVTLEQKVRGEPIEHVGKTGPSHTTHHTAEEASAETIDTEAEPVDVEAKIMGSLSTETSNTMTMNTDDDCDDDYDDDDDDDDAPTKIASVSLIDFAHSKHASAPDEDSLRGLDALIVALKALEKSAE